jgi:hypothetical protein
MSSIKNTQMELASEEETKRFLGSLWFRWGDMLLNHICNQYDLSEEQREAVVQILSRPNDWIVEIGS